MTAFSTQVIDMNVLKIRESLEAQPHSDARTDCLEALSQSQETLEKFLDACLWVPVDYAFDNEQDKKFYKDAGKIEQELVAKGLIYND